MTLSTALATPGPRAAEALLASGLAVIDAAVSAGAVSFAPLLSGGHDSICACYVASQHPKVSPAAYHIKTGIGARAALDHVRFVCRDFGWTLTELKSSETYEKFVRERGFPGPGMHQWAYVRLKERCIRQIIGSLPGKVALITGCRSAESERRMGHVAPVQVGEVSKKTGKVREKRRIWTSPCHDWTDAEQRLFINEFGLPRNPLKESPIGMSGECFCGAFARPFELDLIRLYAPDVAAEIDRLSLIARECGKHHVWGTRPKGDQRNVVATGPLCSSCDRNARAAGVVFVDLEAPSAA